MIALVIGSGGREHAICWKFSLDPKITKIYCLPGNGGTAMLQKCENVNIYGIENIVNFAKKVKPDMTVVGSEEFLVNGIVDEFEKYNLTIFGPNKKAAMLEGSKVFAKNFMKKYGIKTAQYETFNDVETAKKYIENCNIPIVIKASGLAAGKGVIICNSRKEAQEAIATIMIDKTFNDAGNEIVIEEFLDGVEASILTVTDCKTIKSFISAKDHKKIGENETGLNTGGMGAIAPNPYVNEKINKKFISDILNPTLIGMQAEKMDFAGTIFFGLMIKNEDVYLLEYNMRMGDPETQAIIPLLKTELYDIFNACLEKKLDKLDIQWENKNSCCLCLVSKGYPKKYEKGFEIKNLEKVNNQIFVAGAKNTDNKLITSGGRVLNIVAVEENLQDACKSVYKDAKIIDFENKYYRKDIGVIK